MESEYLNLGYIMTICQINVEGLSSNKADYLGKLLAEEKVDILNIEEHHCKDQFHLSRRGKIPGFWLVAATFH